MHTGTQTDRPGWLKGQVGEGGVGREEPDGCWWRSGLSGGEEGDRLKGDRKGEGGEQHSGKKKPERQQTWEAGSKRCTHLKQNISEQVVKNKNINNPS